MPGWKRVSRFGVGELDGICCARAVPRTDGGSGDGRTKVSGTVVVAAGWWSVGQRKILKSTAKLPGRESSGSFATTSALFFKFEYLLYIHCVGFLLR